MPLPDTDTDADADAPTGPRKRNRTLLITGAGATLAALLTGAFLGGLFAYDSPSRDGSPPEGVRARVPEGASQAGAASVDPPRVATSAPPSKSPTSSPSTTPPDNSALPTGASATPTAAPSGAGPTTSAAPEPSDGKRQPPVLRLGDQGPEATELQLRLRQIGFYGGAVDCDYDREVEVEGAVRAYQLTRVVLGDGSGVYGRATRASLECETPEP
ncbi:MULTISPECIES: peptidoglycan-binding domain-containing protein [unclassified Streptomyces]|uniref:peptidoglycan-binding domain-containing protein n=1 Tax=unclassified Streptomyces TaxID=2593676 RepID=UPI0023659981|nr:MULTISPECIES: peptidoglycan-binding domain-containing protein [unclassified Streptomyces]MDF3144811.1 peptidoglycan-binding domain-containing protein [Streptomyces sp. T21Q-yed]WDF43795.1 peptidoglycan-binding domain-containing protein [Streptomyces sp. T12]